MKIEIIGLEKVSYDKADGKHVEGYNINYVEPLNPPSVGLRCSRDYVSANNLPDNLRLGDAEVFFGRGFNGNAYISNIQMIEK